MFKRLRLTSRARVAPKPIVCTIAFPPVCPCEIAPAGKPGILLLGENVYSVTINATLPETGEPVVYGYRLAKDDGESYDLPADASTCECKCHLRWGHCKHQDAVRELKRRLAI